MEIARHWRLSNQRYTLTGAVCSHCGKQFVSARPVCNVCHTSDVSTQIVGRHEIMHEEPARLYELEQR